MAKSSKTIIAYKGFDKDFKCRDFQYEVGKTYEHEGEVLICSSGFHACENPFDVWDYYGPLGSKFAKVKMVSPVKDKSSDDMLAPAKITVMAELTLPEFIADCIDWLGEKTKSKSKNGYSAKLASSGDYAQLASSGYSGVISSSGISTMAKGSVGTWISLAEFDGDYKCIGFAVGCIGKDGLKPDTYYRAQGGKLVEKS